MQIFRIYRVPPERRANVDKALQELQADRDRRCTTCETTFAVILLVLFVLLWFGFGIPTPISLA